MQQIPFKKKTQALFSNLPNSSPNPSIIMTSSLPKTYKALFFDKKGAELTIRDVELKQPGPGYVLVKVVACGVCHSDRFVQQGNFGDVFPRVPGHEAVGDIVAIGEGVTRFKIGERIGGGWHGGKLKAVWLLL
jgi:D-arabinose 1-dehydrogenase-like Zn-dependent alcohol dehydrogenase